MVFPVVLNRCESWTLKRSEHQRNDAFKLGCWGRLLRVSWTARRSNQSILKEISPGYSLEGLMLKLKLQYFGHLMQRADSLEKTLSLGKIERDDRRSDGWMASLTWWTWVWVNSGSWWWTGRPGVLWFMGSQRVGHDWATKLNWANLISHFTHSLPPNVLRHANCHVTCIPKFFHSYMPSLIAHLLSEDSVLNTLQPSPFLFSTFVL